MNTRTGVSRVLFIIVLVSSAVVLAVAPWYASAQGGGNMAEGANASCMPFEPMCPCKMMKNPDPKGPPCIPGANQKDCPCENTTSGQTTTGICSQPGKCEAKSSSGSGVDSMLGQLGQMLSKAMESLKGGGGGGGGGGQQQPPPQQQQPGAGQTGACTTYYQVSVPSSDPCAYYVPPTGDIGGDLLNSLNGPGGAVNSTGGAQLTPLITSPAGSTQAPSGALVPTSWGTGAGLGGLIDKVITGPTSGASGGTAPQGGGLGAGQQNGSVARPPTTAELLSNSASINLQPNTSNTGYDEYSGSEGSAKNKGIGESFFATPDAASPTSADAFTSFTTVGSLGANASSTRSTSGGSARIGPDGATIYASDQGGQGNTVSSGFFGSDTFGGAESPGVLGWLCQTRPWAQSLISKIIPDSFFDNACTARGYRVGPPPAKAPVLTQTSVPVNKKSTATTTRAASSTAPAVAPNVQIWAVPAIVSIGSRTSVFWSARGVESCIVTSPDGSFHQTALAGGASTVPLTSATTYTISCITPDGFPATDYFTVKMAI